MGADLTLGMPPIIGTDIDEDTFERLQAVADRRGVTVEELFRIVLEDYAARLQGE